ncbi:DM13 domain-containing protein [Maricurvus nonylphenolicus]|uniref:DM13 domain-containing protein n=1 Tax=Maricurvus nonylphenolicus TaxID=1008307 RepID=UPI0036F1D298
MKVRMLILLLASHLSVGAVGFAVGIYALPILIAPPPPSETEIQAMSAQASFTAEFKKDLQDSDAFHWGEGQVTIGSQYITFTGELAPGPDYKLYLSPEFVETEADFNRLKSSMTRVGDVKTFNNFVVELSVDVNPSQYTSVIVWCETFGEFITAAKYR